MINSNSTLLKMLAIISITLGSCSQSNEVSNASDSEYSVSTKSEKRYLIYSEEKNEFTENKLEIFVVGKPKLTCGRNIFEAKLKGVEYTTLIFTTSGASTQIIPGTYQRYIDIPCPTERCFLYISEKKKDAPTSNALIKIDLLPYLEKAN